MDWTGLDWWDVPCALAGGGRGSGGGGGGGGASGLAVAAFVMSLMSFVTLAGGGGFYAWRNRHDLFGNDWRRDSFYDNGTALLDSV